MSILLSLPACRPAQPITWICSVALYELCLLEPARCKRQWLWKRKAVDGRKKLWWNLVMMSAQRESGSTIDVPVLNATRADLRDYGLLIIARVK
jgi:hypothetical protein